MKMSVRSRGATVSAVATASLALLTSGCATDYFRDTVDWEALHLQATPPKAVISLSDQGYDACINILEDAILHATEDARGTSFFGKSQVNTNQRPVTSIVIYPKNGDTVHANVIAGVDASGKCFADWKISQVWRTSCGRVADRLEWMKPYESFARPAPDTIAYQNRDKSNITIFLTKIGFRRCLMTAGETAYWEGDGQDVPQVPHFPLVKPESKTEDPE